MSNSIVRVPPPRNEPVRDYAPGSVEKVSLKAKLAEMASEEIEIPVVVGGREIRTGDLAECVMPHDHGHVLARYHQAGEAEVAAAADAARAAWATWSETPWEARAAVFLRAAELLAGPWRDAVNGATMLGQSKTVYQAEIDSACELIDFWRFNPAYLAELYSEQPNSSPGCWNRLEMRALEGFVFAVTPFNFTSIAGNLPTAPAMMGNVSLWKPASSAVYSGWFIYKALEAAGVPPGVISFLPGRGATVGDPALGHPDLAGVHFTGSTGVFHRMWKTIGENIERYRGYPRIVGETGGKDFVFAHASASVDALTVALVRGAFEFQGQKCSAASRAFVPASIWPELRDGLAGTLGEISMGAPTDFRNFVGAVIDRGAYRSIKAYVDHAKDDPGHEVLCGGGCDDSVGWFIEPTVVVASDPKSKLMSEEIFGPVLTVFVYDDAKLDDALTLCDEGSPYGLTGAVFAKDRAAIEKVSARLRHTAGNFYINDKPTGAVVGQQPFGGDRASGTNDKAGSKMNLLRWCSHRTIKELFVPPTSHAYPFMGEE